MPKREKMPATLDEANALIIQLDTHADEAQAMIARQGTEIGTLRKDKEAADSRIAALERDVQTLQARKPGDGKAGGADDELTPEMKTLAEETFSRQDEETQRRLDPRDPTYDANLRKAFLEEVRSRAPKTVKPSLWGTQGGQAGDEFKKTIADMFERGTRRATFVPPGGGAAGQGSRGKPGSQNTPSKRPPDGGILSMFPKTA